MESHARGAFAVVVATALTFGGGPACSSSSPPPEDPVLASYGAREATRLVPFPSNRWTKPDPSTKTGLRVDIRAETTADPMVPAFPSTIAALDGLDGFSTVGPIVVAFDKDIDPKGIADAMALVDVDDASPSRGKRTPLVPKYYTTAGETPDAPPGTVFDSSASVSDFTLLAQPAEPLRPRTKYLFVLADRVKTPKGGVVRASPEMRALLDGAEKGAYADSVRSALPAAESAAGITKDHVVLASVFTTASVRDVLETAAAERRAAPAPKLVEPFTVQQSGQNGDKRVRFVARFESPELRRPKPVGTFELEGDEPKTQATVSLEVFLAFSDATKSGPRPVVIFGHGLGGDKDGTWGTAERLADLGVAVVGIDAPEHGSRMDPPLPPGKDDLLKSVLGFFAADPQTKAFDMERVRDNFRQMAIDQLELVRLVESLGSLDLLPVGAPDGVPDLDPTRILYLGHSFGAVMGPTIGALAPEIKAACWNVGGAGLLTLMRDSGLFSLIVNSFRPAGTPAADVARFFAVTQAIVDPGDPINYARFNTLEALPGVANWAPKDVLLQEVENDNIVPNSSSELLARAAGLAHVGTPTHDVPEMTRLAAPLRANLPSGATGGFFQFSTADGAATSHGALVFTNDGRKQYVELFRSALEGRGVIVDPQAK